MRRPLTPLDANPVTTCASPVATPSEELTLTEPDVPLALVPDVIATFPPFEADVVDPAVKIASAPDEAPVPATRERLPAAPVEDEPLATMTSPASPLEVEPAAIATEPLPVCALPVTMSIDPE